MQVFEKEIRKILGLFKSGKVEEEEAVKQALLAFDKEVSSPSGEDVATRRESFRERMKPFAEKYSAEMLEKFFQHWTGFKTPKSRLMHFEKQKTWNMGARLRTWQENSVRFRLNMRGGGRG